MTDRNPNDPTPEEIKAHCEAIRATWSPREKLKRLCVKAEPVEAEEVATGLLVAVVADDAV